MTTSRRLSEKDVKIIFKSLEQNEYPPENLPYTIVPVSSTALKLSPPSIEFKGKTMSLNILSFGV